MSDSLTNPSSLLTDELRIRLLLQALSDDRDGPPLVKLFCPDGAATWLISEADPDDANRFFALCDLGLGYPQLGYVSLAEISAVRGRLGLPVERDLHFVADKPLSAYAEEARKQGRIIA